MPTWPAAESRIFVELFITEVFDLPRGVSSTFMTLLLGFTFKCWIGKTGLGADTLVYCFE